MSWFPPDRKWLAGGLGGIVTWGLVALANHYLGWTIPADVQTSITGIVTLALAYLVPPSVQDVVRRVNDDIVAIAAADPQSAVSDRTMVLPPATKVVAITAPAPAVATPPALGPQPLTKPPPAPPPKPKGNVE